MPVILFLTMIHLPLALVNIVEKQQKKREDKTVSTPMWDSFRHFFFFIPFSLTHTDSEYLCVCVFFNKRPQREHTLPECT